MPKPAMSKVQCPMSNVCIAELALDIGHWTLDIALTQHDPERIYFKRSSQGWLLLRREQTQRQRATVVFLLSALCLLLTAFFLPASASCSCRLLLITGGAGRHLAARYKNSERGMAANCYAAGCRQPGQDPRLPF